MRRLRRLCEAARAISVGGEVTVRGIPDRDDWWVCIIRVGNVILFESAAGPLDFILDETTRKMLTISQRMKAALHTSSAGTVAVVEDVVDDLPDSEDDPDLGNEG